MCPCGTKALTPEGALLESIRSEYTIRILSTQAFQRIFQKPFFKKPTDSLCVANDGCPRLRILKMKIMVRPLAPSWNQFNLNTPFESSRLRLSNALLLSHALALCSPALAPSSRPTIACPRPLHACSRPISRPTSPALALFTPALALFTPALACSRPISRPTSPALACSRPLHACPRPTIACSRPTTTTTIACPRALLACPRLLSPYLS